MLTGCSTLSRTLIPLIYKRLVTRGSLTLQAALSSSTLTVSSIPPPLHSPTHSHSFLTGSLTSALVHSSVRSSSTTRRLFHSANHSGLMELKEVLQVLEQLAPLFLAESWDNVGLLVEPSKPRPVKTVLLTNDLTDAVMEEAEAMSCDLIISYHPPLFRSIKRLVQKDWKQRLAIRAVEAGIVIFSPHTSWDSVKGGVNDWLVGGLGSGQVSVLSQALGGSAHSHKLEFMVKSTEEVNVIMEELKACDSGTTLQHAVSRPDSSGIHVSVTCGDSALTPSVQTLLRHNAASQSLTILKLEKHPLPGHGQGRLSVLDQPVTVATAIQKMKSHLGLSHLRLALGWGQTLESSVCSVAVCAGSGASVLNGVKADLYITGEMSHHEVLDAAAKGTSVILSDHSNSERGYLAVFRERLAMRLQEGMTVAVSKADRDPLEVV
uniref:NIF3-like protein 1 n=1 Tax=Semicossyphus pulcher TaxID=241346 RepID=UPI0037E8DF8E